MRIRTTAITMMIATAAASGPAVSQAYAPGFFARIYSPTRNPQQFSQLAQWFESSGYLTRVSTDLNQRIAVPRSVQVAAGECGQVNAYFRPNVNPPTVILCYEMVAAINEEFRQDNLTREQMDAALRGTMDFVVYHEIGHALVNELSLPITGREEDVADQFATLVLARYNPDATIWAARFFREMNDPGHLGLKRLFQMNANTFANEHSLDEQRFYNILCWTYGASPSNRTGLLRYIPRQRAVRCPAEYQQLSTAWNTFLANHTTTRRVASSAPPPPPPPPAPPPPPPASGSWLSGQWRYTERIEQPSNGMICDDTGTIVLQGRSGSYAQTGKCTLNGQQFDNPGNGALTTVSVDATTVRFRMETCDYAGTLVRSAPARIEGTVYCVINGDNGITSEARGTWAAER